MNDSRTYTYYAFVSYSHKDEKWGKWIQNALERYRLPAAVRKEVGKPLPKRIHPVFRDDTDLGACRLEDGLQQELEKSRFLIVVCSPNSAKPNAEGKHWVNEEVKHFCDMGRADRVIPVIVSGTAETAFCPKIVEAGLLGLDATKHSRARILNNLVAKILGLRPDELWRREERRLRAKRRWRIFAASVAALFVAVGGFVWWDCTRTVTRAFADYVDSYGLPEGIFPLTDEQVAHRHVHYRFEFRGLLGSKSPHADSSKWNVWSALGLHRRLERVVQANSHGFPIDRDDEFDFRPQIQSFRYDDTGRLFEIRYMKFHGVKDPPILTMRIELYNDEGTTNGLLKAFNREEQRSMAYFMKNDNYIMKEMPSIEASSDITAIAVLRDDHGRPIQTLFQNSSLLCVPNGDGLYGFACKYDKIGRQVALRNIVKVGNDFVRAAGKDGISEKEFLYEGFCLIEMRMLGDDKMPIVGREGFATLKHKYDQYGNIVQVLYFGERNERTTNLEGCAELICSFDSSGNIISKESRNVEGFPVNNKYGFARWTAEYNYFGNMLKQSFFNADGKAVCIENGYATILAEYDDYGNMLLETFWDEEGKPVLDKDGCASIRREFDSSGNCTRESYFGVDGNPVLSINGFAAISMEYDKTGNLVKQCFWGTDGALILKNGEYAEMRRRFNNLGYLEEESYHNCEGNPIMCFNGYARVAMEYDIMGRLTKQRYFGTDGRATITSNGVAEIRVEYDEHGLMASRAFFGIDGTPIAGVEGCALIKMEHDSNGNLIKQSYIGLNGELALCKDGNAGWKAEYDQLGRMVRISYFGKKEEPVLTKDGCAEIKIEYGRTNHDKQLTLYDQYGKQLEFHLCVISSGVVANSPAEVAGVQEGDIWCHFGSYDILETNDFSCVKNSIQATRNSEKQLIVARKDGNDYEILSFFLPVGAMGIRITANQVEDPVRLLNAYRIYLENEKQWNNENP